MYIREPNATWDALKNELALRDTDGQLKVFKGIYLYAALMAMEQPGLTPNKKRGIRLQLRLQLSSVGPVTSYLLPSV